MIIRCPRCGNQINDSRSDSQNMNYPLRVLIGIDQLGNAIANGDPDETISSRIGRMKVKYGGEIPWRRPLAKVIDWGLNKLDNNHSIEAIGQ